ncbi:MAG: helix-turn-helix domain-containing protein [Stellaceae bacterium]
MRRLALYAADAAAIERLATLARGAGCEIIGHAHRPPALAHLLDRNRADAILASPLPGIEPALWLAERRAPFVVIAASDDAAPRRAALMAGAAALLPAETGADELRLALDALEHGLSLVPSALPTALARGNHVCASSAETTSAETLTPRELEVLAALADGASNKAIARRLGISFHTVKFHVAAILEKLDADSRTEAVAEGARRGLVML